MDELSTRPIHYGNLGRAAYDSDTRSWSFARNLAPASRISYAGVTELTIQSPLTTSKFLPIENIAYLPRTYPELAAASTIAYHEKLSQVITATCETYSPLVSSLLDFGHAHDIDNAVSVNRAIPIAVVATGECGNVVSFRTITEHTAELMGDTNTRIRVPSIGEESVEWSMGGASIRQICFSRAVEDTATFMAVRFPCSTAIFRPLYHRNPIPVLTTRPLDSIAQGSVHSSRLDPNFLVEIPSSLTGGFEHADVTFNPWNEQQLAIVDTKGTWGIWGLASREKRNRRNWAVECLKSGSLPWSGIEDDRHIGDSSRHDGWSAIEWVGNDNNIIVCDRRCAILYQMDVEPMTPYPIELSLRRKSEWIVDMIRSPCNSSHVFILTTSQIFWINVAPIHDSVDGKSQAFLYPLLSWRHFRDLEDTTLRLAPLHIGEDLYLVLYSRLNPLTMAFCCPVASESLVDMVSLPDPFILDVPVSSEYEEELHISPWPTNFSTLVFKEVAHSQSVFGRSFYEPNLRLLKAFAVDSHLSVRESIYLGPPRSASDEDSPSARNILRYRRRFRAGQGMKITSVLDDFIVNDWDEPLPDSFDNRFLGAPAITPLAIQQWTLDYTQIYAIATGRSRLLLNESEREGEEQLEISFHASLNQLEHNTFGTPLNNHPASQTALEILRTTPLLDDIDHNAQDLDDFTLRSTSNSQHYRNRTHFVLHQFDPLSSPSFHRNSNEPWKLNLISIYDRLIDNWLVNLPSDMPEHSRIVKEKAIRSITTDLALSTIITTRNLSKDESSDQQKRSVGEMPSSTPTDEESLFVPFATQSSVATGHGILLEDQGATAILSTLSCFTEFKGGDSISSNVERILDQWRPENNPRDYTSTIQILGSQVFRPPATPKRRSRKQPSQNTGLDSSQLAPLPSSVPIVRDYGSQPEQLSQSLAFRLQSSQVTDDLPMTQTERGVFGGREAGRRSAIKARKKKRAAGF